VDGRDLPDTLDVLRKLLVEQEELLGYLLEQTERQLDIADAHPVALAPNNTLFNDLLRVIRKILEAPGLAESLLTALEDPAVLNLPQAAVRLMEFKHPRIGEADFRAGRVFVTRVDRSRPDVADNQSLQQRMWHLIHDTRKARYEPSLVGVPLGFIFEIPDQAEFYMLSIIGRAEIPPLVSRLTGLSERPTPEELAVFLNAEQTFGNPQGNEGIDVRDNDGDTLFAVSASGMKDALRPLVQVFYDRGQLDLLFELFEVLYLHWPSVEGGVYQSTSRSQPKYAQNSRRGALRAHADLAVPRDLPGGRPAPAAAQHPRAHRQQRQAGARRAAGAGPQAPAQGRRAQDARGPRRGGGGRRAYQPAVAPGSAARGASRRARRDPPQQPHPGRLGTSSWTRSTTCS
jgi:hypothetical protein